MIKNLISYSRSSHENLLDPIRGFVVFIILLKLLQGSKERKTKIVFLLKVKKFQFLVLFFVQALTKIAKGAIQTCLK